MFHDVRLEENVERGAQGGPRFKTTIIGVGSGNEQRNQEWSVSRAEWDLSYGITSNTDFEQVRDFFYARRGRAFAFRFKDWTDYAATEQELGLGDDMNTDFQLIKTYGDSAATYTRKITRPVSGTVVIRIDGTPQTEGVDYDIGSLGLIEFDTAPGPGEVVDADFEFDTPVRFDVDFLELEVALYNAGSYPSITIREIRE